MNKGIKGILSMKVEDSMSAMHVGSGLVNVFSTPSLVAFVEKTCYLSVSEFFEEGQTSVGTLVNIKHLKATPIGMKVTCYSELVEIDGKRLVFDFWAEDEVARIAEGRHERYLVNTKKFEESTLKK